MTQNSGSAATTASAVDSIRTGLRPKRSDSQPEASSAGSRIIMLMVLISSACAGEIPSAVCSQLAT